MTNPPLPKVENMACDYYVKCGEVPNCPSAPTSPIVLPINVS
jgi:hypothetical protein